MGIILSTLELNHNIWGVSVEESYKIQNFI